VTPAEAQPLERRARLRVERTESAAGCLDATQLKSMVERRLDRGVFEDLPTAALELRVRLSGGPPWRAHMELLDSGGLLGTRELSTAARHCSALDESVALVVALLVDTPPERPLPPRQSLPEAAPRDSGVPESPRSLPSSRPSRIELPADTFARREPLRLDVYGAGSFSIGLLPTVAPGVALAIGLALPRGPWLRLVGELYPAREGELEAGSGVRIGLLRTGLDVCGGDFEIAGFGADLCAGQRVGRLWAEGFGFDANAETGRLHFTLTAGANLSLPLSRSVGLVLGARAEIPLTRDEFTARADGSANQLIFQAFPVGGSVGVGARFEL